jgi:toxin ParE1/3/4
VKVNFTGAAEAGLEAIADWIAEDDQMRAASFVMELRERCLSLADKPNRFPVARRAGGHVFRKLVYRDYLIFYRVLTDHVEVDHVLHGARDWVGLLGTGR